MRDRIREIIIQISNEMEVHIVKGRVGARSCPYVPLHPALTFAVGGDATHQKPVVKQHPNGVPCANAAGAVTFGRGISIHNVW